MALARLFLGQTDMRDLGIGYGTLSIPGSGGTAGSLPVATTNVLAPTRSPSASSSCGDRKAGLAAEKADARPLDALVAFVGRDLLDDAPPPSSDLGEIDHRCIGEDAFGAARRASWATFAISSSPFDGTHA